MLLFTKVLFMVLSVREKINLRTELFLKHFGCMAHFLSLQYRSVLNCADHSIINIVFGSTS